MFSCLPLSLLLVVSSAFAFVGIAAQSASSTQVSETSVSGVPSSSSTAAPGSSRSGSDTLSGSATSTASLPSFSGYSVCVDDCINSAVAFTGCSSVAEVDCYCASANSTMFAQNLTSCMAMNCPSSIAPAESLANALCAVASSSTSISFATTSLSASTTSSASPSNTSHSASRSATSMSSSASATTTGTNAAMRQGTTSNLVITMAAGLVLAALGVLSGL